MSVICLSEIRYRIKDIFQEANPSKQEHIARASETTKDQEEIREEETGLCQEADLAVFFSDLDSFEL